MLETQASNAEITKFASEAMHIADRRTVTIIGKVGNAELILEKTGMDVAGFTRVLDNYGCATPSSNTATKSRKADVDRSLSF